MNEPITLYHVFSCDTKRKHFKLEHTYKYFYDAWRWCASHPDFNGIIIQDYDDIFTILKEF